MENSNITLEILKILVSLVSLIVTYYAVPYLKSKANNEKFKQIQDWANIVVLALQQKDYKDADKDKVNKAKFNEAIDLIEMVCNNVGINLNNYEITMLVESAVKNMKIAESLQQNTKDTNTKDTIEDKKEQ